MAPTSKIIKIMHGEFFDSSCHSLQNQFKHQTEKTNISFIELKMPSLFEHLKNLYDNELYANTINLVS